MAKTNRKQNRLLKKYSKGGFSKNEKNILSKKLSIKPSQVRRLTKSYSKQFKIASSSKPNTTKSKSSPFGTQASTYAPGVSATGAKQPNKSKSSPFKTKTSTYAPGVSASSVKKPKNSSSPSQPTKPNNTTTPKNTTTPTNPTRPSDPNDIREIVRGIIDDQTPTPELTVDPRIGNLENELQTANTNLENLQNLYNTSTDNYLSQVDQLRGDISGYENRISGYEDQISNMSSQLLEQAERAKQFKQMDTQYLSNNTASGIRLRRSKKFRSGDFALGTSGLNRKNRSPLKISNVNL